MSGADCRRGPDSAPCRLFELADRCAPCRVAATAADMQAACDEYNAAWRAGADAATLYPLRVAHSVARSAWMRARAAAGDGQARALVAIGAA